MNIFPYSLIAYTPEQKIYNIGKITSQWKTEVIKEENLIDNCMSEASESFSREENETV